MSTPAWISNLSDPLLKANFTTYAHSGVVTEAEMTTTLTTLQSEILRSSGVVSQSQLADLASIARNIASLHASPYLQFITSAFVTHLEANHQDFALMVRKLFLGSDMPGAAFTDYSDPANPVVTTFSYQTVSAPLFSTGGPVMTDVNQGALGDCYLLASLAEVAHQDPSAITSMITDNQNGTFGVRFFVDGAARYVTVNRELADGGALFASATHNVWAALVETAYAKVQAQGDITDGSINAGASFTTIGNGGQEEEALEEITGASVITDFSPGASATAWAQSIWTQPMDGTGPASAVSATSLLSTLAADLLIGDSLDLDSSTNATGAHGAQTLVAGHIFSIYGFDTATGDLEIRNPWGSKGGSGVETTFEVSLNTLRAADDWITTANTGTATTVSGASVVAASALQGLSQVTSFSVTDTAAHVAGAIGELMLDTKLSALTVSGTAGGDSLNLVGIGAAATVNLGGNADAAVLSGVTSNGSGVGAATGFSIGSSPFDFAMLGTGATTIDHTLNAAGGVEDILGFNSAHDLLSIGLNGGSLEQTLVGGGDWLSSSTDLTHGVFLTGVTHAQAVTVSNGIATVS